MDNNTTSYFGVQGNTFYAGPNGASFQIKSSAKFGNYRELLNNSVASILIGDYLLVNYGNQADPTDTSSSPNHKSYGENMAIDAYSGSGTDPLQNVDPLSRPGYYNATIWQKTGEGQYELVFGCASAAPNISIITDSSTINPGSLTNAEIITKNLNSSVMSQEFKLKPIKPWNINFETVVGNPSVDPSISLKNDGSIETKTFIATLPKAWNIASTVAVNEINSNDDASASFESSNNNTKTLTLNLPAPWDFSSNVSVVSANATENASASIEEIEENGQDKKQLTLTIPSIWNIELGENLSVGSNGDPQISINRKQTSSSSESNTTKYLHFGIPKVPNLEANYEIVDSTESGEVSGTYINNTTYQFNFKIPKGSKIKAGTALFNASTGSVSFLQNEDPLNGLLKGDFYINSTLGTIYEITSVNDHIYSIENRGSVQIPGFSINPTALSTTYNVSESNGTFSITPNITINPIDVTKPSNQNENWTINLPVINPPTSNYSIQLVSSATQGGVNITSPQTGRIDYNIRIPRGSRIFSGEDKTTAIANQSYGIGDYFLNTRSKKLFALDDEGNTLSEGTLLSGDSFAIYHLENQDRWSVTQSQLGLQNPSEEDVVSAIKSWLSAQLLNADPQPNQFSEMVDVLYTDNSNNNTSYWFYKTGEGSENWNAIRLSANVGSSIIENVTYSTSRNSSTTTYSAAWINALKTDLNNSISNRTTEARVNTLITNAINEIDVGSPAIQWGTWDEHGNITES